MKEINESIEAIRDIRDMMSRSSRFISLSGLSGVIIGLFAISGIIYTYLHFEITTLSYQYYNITEKSDGTGINEAFRFFILVPSIILIFSLLVSVILTIRKTIKKGLPVWDLTTKRLILSMSLPVVTGGIFCVALAINHFYAMIAPATLIFYGIALISTAKLSLKELNYLGISECICGLAGAFFPDLGLIFWGLGFGLAHIVYGLLIYFRYEK
jgi:hypothetical protein